MVEASPEIGVFLPVSHEVGVLLVSPEVEVLLGVLSPPTLSFPGPQMS